MALSMTGGSKSFIQNMQEPKNGLTLCYACHPGGACRMGIFAEELLPDGRVRARMRAPADFEASPGIAHGGWTAAIMDEVCGHVPIRLGSFSVTGKLTIEYKKPVPVGVDLDVLAWATNHRHGLWKISAEMRVSGCDEVLSRAEGQFVERDMAHYEQHAQKMARR
jgi:acyl-coenzyme A thioesterase PaaI-like protein